MFSIHAQIACIERTIHRLHEYPTWSDGTRMSRYDADREIVTMEAVLQTLKGLAPPEKTLFDEVNP